MKSKGLMSTYLFVRELAKVLPVMKLTEEEQTRLDELEVIVKAQGYGTEERAAEFWALAFKREPRRMVRAYEKMVKKSPLFKNESR